MTFDFTPTADGLRIHDTIENAWTDVDVGGSVEPEPASTDVFRVPLDEAVVVETERLAFDANLSVMARDRSGAVVGRSLPGGRLELEAGSYELDTTFTLFRLYATVEDASLVIADSPDGTSFEFDRPTTVTLGVRSHHEQPAGVVTTSQDPRDMMRAVSTFGSAMKTFSPERSYPSLRGHPPELAVRGQTSIPDTFAPPETGITVEVPPEYAAVFTSAPLAYYLGATIEPGLDPRLVADDAVHEFDPDALPDSVFDVLRHCFLLDTVVRTVGIYPLDISAQRRLQERVSIDREHLYDLPIEERTARYLDIPLATTRDLLAWRAVADIDPVPLNAEALPYLTYRMAAVRSPPAGSTQHSGCCSPEDDRPPEQTTPESSSVRSFTPGEPDAGNTVSFVDPAPFDAEHHIWVGDGLPVTGSKPTLGSYLRSTDASPHDGVIDVHVVVTDSAARPDIDALASQYSAEGFAVTVHDHPTTSELKDILLDDVDFLHYRGTVSDAGLECLDGPLDIRILPRTGVSAFFLDGKCSYRQGLPLIRVGAIGGVVTTDDEHPAGDHPGLTLAALLNYGYPLGPAVDVLTDLEDDARYTIVGDSFHQICKSTTLPILLAARPDRTTPDSITPDSRVYPSQGYELGSTYGYGGSVDEVEHLTGTHAVTFTHDSFRQTADQMEAPLLVDQELHWPEGYTADELWELLQ